MLYGQIIALQKPEEKHFLISYQLVSDNILYKRDTAFENNTISVSKQSIYAIEAAGRKTNKRKTTTMQKKRSRCYICTGNDNKYRTKCDICYKHICNVHSVCETNTFCIYCEDVE